MKTKLDTLKTDDPEKASRNKAIIALEKAKKIEQDRLSKGWQYHFTDKNTQVLRKPKKQRK